MKYDPEKHHRRSIRIPNFDYSQDGWYFVTICSHQRERLFGDVVDGVMVINKFGDIVNSEWIRTAQLRHYITLDEFVVMPNHIHGIININIDGVGAHGNVPLHKPQIEKFGKSTKNSIPTIVKLFKSTITKQINEIRHSPGVHIWQKNYYEHIIRDEIDLNRIRQYIQNNPLKWPEDKYFI